MKNVLIVTFASRNVPMQPYRKAKTFILLIQIYVLNALDIMAYRNVLKCALSIVLIKIQSM